MKRRWNILGILGCLTLIFSMNAHAETFRGEIKNLNADANSFVLIKTEQETGKKAVPQELNVQVSPKAKFAGVASLQELRAGDEIKVNAKQNKKTGQWEARSLFLDKVQIRSNKS